MKIVQDQNAGRTIVILVVFDSVKKSQKGAERGNFISLHPQHNKKEYAHRRKVHLPTGLMGQKGPGCRWDRVPVPVPAPVPLFSLARCQSDLKYIVCSRCNRVNLLYMCVIVYLYVQNVGAVFDVFLSV